MARAEYTVWICDNRGRHLQQVQDFLRLDWSQIVGDIGVCELRLPARYFEFVQLPDAIIEVTRTLDNSSVTVPYFARGERYEIESNGRETYTLTGYDLNYLLTSRIIAYASDTASASHTDSADDVIKAFVRENLGSSAIAARDLTSYGLTVAADLGVGVSLTKAAAWRSLFNTVQAVAEASVTDGTRVYWGFTVTGLNPLQFVFETRTTQWGQDRTGGTELSVPRGTLRAATLERDFSGEGTFVYGLGGGIESGRTQVTVTDTTRSSTSPWARREAKYEETRTTNTATLTDGANARLEELKPLHVVRGELGETFDFRYGIHWGLGDLFKVRVADYVATVMIRAVKISQVSGKEEISATLEQIG